MDSDGVETKHAGINPTIAWCFSDIADIQNSLKNIKNHLKGLSTPTEHQHEVVQDATSAICGLVSSVHNFEVCEMLAVQKVYEGR